MTGRQGTAQRTAQGTAQGTAQRMSGLIDAARSWLERGAAALARAMPPPPFQQPLARLEHQLVTQLLADHQAEVNRAKQAFSSARQDTWQRGAAMDTTELENIAEKLLVSLRERMECLPWDHPVLALVARLDQSLPTDEGEYMDDPRLDAGARDALSRVLDKSTRRAGDYLVLADLLAPLLAQCAAGRNGAPAPMTILDLGSGSGGFPITVARLFGERHHLRVVSTDVVDEYLELARAASEAAGVVPWMGFQRLDALRLDEELRGWRPDIVTCTRSLHHFGVRGTVRVLAQALGCAAHGVMFIDIVRSISRMMMACGAGAGSGSWRFLHDAVISVRKSFTRGEMSLIAACVPGAERLEIGYAAPAYFVARGPSLPRTPFAEAAS